MANKPTEQTNLSPIQLIGMFFLILLVIVGLIIGYVNWANTLPPDILQNIFFVILILVGLIAGIITIGILKGTAAVKGGTAKIKWLSIDKIEARGAVAVMIIVMIIAYLFKPSNDSQFKMKVYLRDENGNLIHDFDDDPTQKIYYELLDSDEKGDQTIHNAFAEFDNLSSKINKRNANFHLENGDLYWELINEKWKISNSVTLKFKRPEQCRIIKFKLVDLNKNPVRGHVLIVEGKKTSASDTLGRIDFLIKDPNEIKDEYNWQVEGTSITGTAKPCITDDYEEVRIL